MEQYSSATEYAQRFNAAEMWDGFRQKWQGPKVVTARVAEIIQLRLKATLARYKWRSEGFYEVLNADDIVIKKGLEKIRQ